jgi:GNAT superfamily N-acetyltransferase
MNDAIQPELATHPLTWDRRLDFEALFAPHNGHSGCWCRWFKQTNAEYERLKGETNRQAMLEQVRSGPVPGLLAYRAGQTVGWCAVEPREEYPRLSRSRILEKIDDRPVWSLTCFYVATPFRKMGTTESLIRAVVEHVRASGGKLIEAYPVEPPTGRIRPADAFHGLASTFRRLGFEECARRSPTRPIMRLDVQKR